MSNIHISSYSIDSMTLMKIHERWAVFYLVVFVGIQRDTGEV